MSTTNSRISDEQLELLQDLLGRQDVVIVAPVNEDTYIKYNAEVGTAYVRVPAGDGSGRYETVPGAVRIFLWGAECLTADQLSKIQMKSLEKAIGSVKRE